MKLKADLKCPNCNKQFNMRVENLHPGNSYRCSNCHTTIQFTGDDGREVQKALDDLQKTIEGFSN